MVFTPAFLNPRWRPNVPSFSISPSPVWQADKIVRSTDDKSIRDIGWFISKNNQRKGYAYEAASKVLNYMFKEVEINKIETSVAMINPASWHLMEKLGFKRLETTHKNKYYFVEEPVESYEYILEEFEGE